MSNIFSIFDKIADQKIREAMEHGEFEDLPGKGKPLNLEDDSHLPQDLRLAYKILKNADCLPPEIELRNEIRTTEALLAGIQDTQEKYKQMKKLNYLMLKLSMTRRGSLMLEENQRYYEKAVDKMKVNKEGKSN
ncbi:MAG: DnaJ family domain-containing protein [Desulfoferrobacter sp.]